MTEEFEYCSWKLIYNRSDNTWIGTYKDKKIIRKKLNHLKDIIYKQVKHYFDEPIYLMNLHKGSQSLPDRYFPYKFIGITFGDRLIEECYFDLQTKLLPIYHYKSNYNKWRWLFYSDNIKEELCYEKRYIEVDIEELIEKINNEINIYI